MSLEVDEHRELLDDPVRVGAYRAAIRAVVRPGAVVADIGAGSGVLGMLACEAGAARVYSIEAGGMIEVARAVSLANGFADRQTFLHGMSTDLSLPEPVDVVVSDQIGHFGCEAGQFEYFADARARYLKPEGRMIPARIDLQVAPVEVPEVSDRVQFWLRRPAGFDFAPAHAWTSNTGYPLQLTPVQLLAEPACLVSADMATVSIGRHAGSVTARVTRAGTLHGVGGWFHATLADGVTMTNSPVARDRIRRRNAVFPIATPVAVAPGDEVTASIQFRPVETVVTWDVEVWTGVGGRRRRVASERHSTFAGMLITRDELARMKPDFVPTLTERGRARMSVLTLCDGTRPLVEVEQQVYTRHRALFSSSRDAAAFVAEVVTRYAR